MLDELEKIVEKRIDKIDKKANMKKEREYLVAQEFEDNKEILIKYMKKHNLSTEDMYFELMEEISELNTNTFLEAKVSDYKIKDALNELSVKLGYREIFNPDKKEINPEMIIEQCSLSPTEKGRKLYEEYNSLST
jgi:hypothetical protein